MLSTSLRSVWSGGWSFRRKVSIARSFWDREEHDRALAFLQTCSKRRTGRSHLFDSEAARLLMSVERWGEAHHSWVAAALALDGKTGRTIAETGGRYLLNAATCSYLAGDIKMASIDLLISTELDSNIQDTPEYYLLKGRILMKINAHKGIDILIAGVGRYPDDHALLFEAASNLRLVGRYVESAALAARAVYLKPNDEPSRHIYRESSKLLSRDRRYV